MSDAFELTVHESQWPATLAVQLQEALKARRIPSKFLYETPRQVRRWLRLHERCSPARTDADCQRAYQACFEAASAIVGSAECEVLGLGCGGGQKEVGLARTLQDGGASVSFLPCDVSAGLVITTLQHAAARLRHPPQRGLVCDLARAAAWSEFSGGAGGRRVVTFFGLIPSLEPREVAAILRGMLRSGDLLACSANLHAGPDVRAAMEAILPQYDNEPTRSWLGVAIDDLGLTRVEGELRFRVEECASLPGSLRITADFEFRGDCAAHVAGATVPFGAGERLRVFSSYRHTPATLRERLGGVDLEAVGHWLSADSTEGVWLFRHR